MGKDNVKPVSPFDARVYTGTLPTINDDNDPAYEDWYLQLWEDIGPKPRRVARVYGSSVDDVCEYGAYLAHAANEYPRLRERVRELEAALRDVAAELNSVDVSDSPFHHRAAAAADIARKALEAKDAK